MSLAAIATAAATLYGYWHHVGWKTPHGHESDLAIAETAVLSAIQALSTKVSVNQDQWLCDENTEELVELLQAQAIDETVERDVKIHAVREKMRSLDCSRFED